LMPKRAINNIQDLTDSWKDLQIDGWTSGEYPWFFLSEKLSERMAAVVGADKEEVIVTGSTTVNIHQVVSTFYQPEGKRTKIVATSLDFPTDIYAMQSQIKLKGYDPEEHL